MAGTGAVQEAGGSFLGLALKGGLTMRLRAIHKERLKDRKEALKVAKQALEAEKAEKAEMKQERLAQASTRSSLIFVKNSDEAKAALALKEEQLLVKELQAKKAEEDYLKKKDTMLALKHEVDAQVKTEQTGSKTRQARLTSFFGGIKEEKGFIDNATNKIGN